MAIFGIPTPSDGEHARVFVPRGLPMPGGDIEGADFEGWLARFGAAHPWLPPDLARHYGRL